MTGLFGDDDNTPQSKGGKARARSLGSDRRAEIARKAALARWSTPEDNVPKAICGSSDKPMRIPSLGIEIPCYVIEGERRVLVQRGMVEGLGMARGSAGGGGDRLANFVQGERIKSFISSELSDVIVNPIKFRAPNGSIAYGYDAEVLHSLCLAITIGAASTRRFA